MHFLADKEAPVLGVDIFCPVATLQAPLTTPLYIPNDKLVYSLHNRPMHLLTVLFMRISSTCFRVNILPDQFMTLLYFNV